jgi:hypothetical protein
MSNPIDYSYPWDPDIGLPSQNLLTVSWELQSCLLLMAQSAVVHLNFHIGFEQMTYPRLKLANILDPEGPLC